MPATGKTRHRTRDRSDPAQRLRARARRRLIGAAALLLAAVIVVPMLLDPAPKPLPGNIPIELPSEKSPFKPGSRCRRYPSLATRRWSPPPDAEADAQGPAKTGACRREVKSAATDDQGRRNGQARPRRKANPRRPRRRRRIALQVAALGSEAAARELVAALEERRATPPSSRRSIPRKARVVACASGPYASREDAEQARTKLRAAGFQANAVTS